ncbi:MAG: NADH-quinone oxidoreductase subunit C [Alphaproteobacteria bacterium 16-39-46]|nr:MAG: NADH-quinone oxidoreductase subunit C [Alphaproteobacteria bacterium 16-39-46]OZA43529.1 MAG: NADH-quinone oxidoreductase subunit C [Alphaproteobacteria bacterium 17-39-52]HQS83844.1 NADH-quinone oxidoreductase subunit C [Alphaproteobacteria bacterium]HQS93693.1 NADH-quinone oxidoreductase subunit C [Alphaproteobacteria bacterium]
MDSKNSQYQTLLASLQENWGQNILESSFEKEELSVRVTAESLLSSVVFLKENPNCLCQCLMDIAGVDYPERERRFDVVYQFLSLKHNLRVRLKVGVFENEIVPSLTEFYPSANWWEREVWDLYGVPFGGHPDLRRILTDYGFENHPLRKDFPLTGFLEVRYDEVQKRVVYEPVKLDQAYRDFDFLSPWEGPLAQASAERELK